MEKEMKSKKYISLITMNWKHENSIVIGVMFFEDNKQVKNIIFDDVIEKICNTFVNCGKDFVDLGLRSVSKYERDYVDGYLVAYFNNLIQFKKSNFVLYDYEDDSDYEKHANVYR